MSRFTGTLENGNSYAYGLDRALGYFYDEWDTDADGEDRILVELCCSGPFRSADRIEISNRVAKIPEAVRKLHHTRIALDLPI